MFCSCVSIAAVAVRFAVNIYLCLYAKNCIACQTAHLYARLSVSVWLVRAQFKFRRYPGVFLMLFKFEIVLFFVSVWALFLVFVYNLAKKYEKAALKQQQMYWVNKNFIQEFLKIFHFQKLENQHLSFQTNDLEL